MSRLRTDEQIDLLSTQRCPDINAVAAVIKLYFRELVEPIFPYDRYDSLWAAVSTFRRGHAGRTGFFDVGLSVLTRHRWDAYGSG